MATSGTAQLRYDRLIRRAVERGVPVGYAEKHHIVPRSLGGGDDPANLVLLTAREHFLAHWMLFKIHRSPATARAFKLMANDQGRRRGRDYAAAREVMAEAMRGDKNVSRRPEIRAKLVEKAYSPFAGKKRPEHAALLRSRGLWSGDKNPGLPKCLDQSGTKNHMARRVVGVHPFFGPCDWPTASCAALALEVSVQAVAQAIKLKGRSKQWRLEYA
jgi:hypothetical protein